MFLDGKPLLCPRLTSWARVRALYSVKLKYFNRGTKRKRFTKVTGLTDYLIDSEDSQVKVMLLCHAAYVAQSFLTVEYSGEQNSPRRKAWTDVFAIHIK